MSINRDTIAQRLPSFLEPTGRTAHLRTTLARSLLCVFDDLAILCDQKQQDYGDRNLLDFGAYGVLVRTNDKMQRLKNLYKAGAPAARNEPRLDTWADMANYAVIGWLMEAQLWGGQEREDDRSPVLVNLHGMHRGVDSPEVGVDVENFTVTLENQMATDIEGFTRELWPDDPVLDADLPAQELWANLTIRVRGLFKQHAEWSSKSHAMSDQIVRLAVMNDKLREDLATCHRLMANVGLTPAAEPSKAKAIPDASSSRSAAFILPDGSSTEERLQRLGAAYHDLQVSTRAEVLRHVPISLHEKVPVPGHDYEHLRQPSLTIRVLGLALTHPDNSQPTHVMVLFEHIGPRPSWVEGPAPKPYLRTEVLGYFIENYDVCSNA